MAFALVACSQGDTHPPNLGDCDSCAQPINDASVTTDASAKDASTKPDSSTTIDAGVDAASDSGVDASDSSILDTGASG